MKKAYVFGALALAGLVAAPVSPALAKKPAPVAAFDTDNDATVDLNEIDKAAEALFGKLEKDNDGTLDKKEVQGRLTRQEFKEADPDGDGTLDKNEFLAAVGKLFKVADPDNDGTLDEKEFAAPEGKALLRVTR